MLEPSWPHMQLVYEILLRFVLSKEVDSKTAKEYFSKKFMTKLLSLFDSEDPRERDYLKVWRMPCSVFVTIDRKLIVSCMARPFSIASTASRWRCARSFVVQSTKASTRLSTRRSRSMASVSSSRFLAGV
jgi:hypothetical protein